MKIKTVDELTTNQKRIVAFIGMLLAYIALMIFLPVELVRICNAFLAGLTIGKWMQDYLMEKFPDEGIKNAD